MKKVVPAAMIAVILLMGLAIILAATGRLPRRELALVWTKVVTGASPLDPKPSTEPEPPAEEPSFEQLLRSRTQQEREIERQRLEAQSLLELAKARQTTADESRQAIAKLRAELEKGYEDKQAEYVKQGRQNLLEKLEVMKPDLAKQFLLDQAETDEEVTLELLKKLEPVTAGKIFKEFKQPAELEKLNGLLAKLGQGEPEASQVKELADQSPAAVP